ncbi:MAG: TIGR03560 family F420-dependent LLM class oxidoreductase [Dehalococcoidia bacterium]
MQIFAGQVRFGIHAGPQNTNYADYVHTWKRAEELGYDWASVFDHFMPISGGPIDGPCFEGPTLLAALAAQTSTIRCGILVVGNTYRNPAVLANIFATIDHVSNGRVELGIGAGWYEAEHEQYNIPFYTPGRRIRMLGESVKIIRSLFENERTTFNGRYYTVHEALLAPKPVQPRLPIWVGGAGEQLTLRVVAESADGWNTFFMSPEEYRAKLEVLAGHCCDVGRDPAEIRKSLAGGLLVGETEAEVAERTAELGTVQRGIAGTPEQCIEQILEYVKLGVGDFLFSARPPVDFRSLELFQMHVAPAVRAEAATILAAG